MKAGAEDKERRARRPRGENSTGEGEEKEKEKEKKKPRRRASGGQRGGGEDGGQGCRGVAAAPGFEGTVPVKR